MRRKSSIQSNDIEDLKRQNTNIENQSKPWNRVGLGLLLLFIPKVIEHNLNRIHSLAVRQLERARDSYNGDGDNPGAAGGSIHQEGEEDSSEEATANGGGVYARRTKKMKTNGNY